MEKLTGWLEEKVYPLAAFFEQNKYLSSIQYGIMLTIPLLLVGAFACIISDFPWDGYQNFMISIFGEQAWGEWNWSVLNPATFGLIALVTMIGTSYELSRKNKVSPLPGIVMSLMGYFILVHVNSDSMISMNEFGASSLFLSIIVAILSVEIYTLCLKKNFVIKMPDSIPSFVVDQFTALVPAVICGVIFLAARYVIQITPYTTAYNMIYGLLQAPLTTIGTTFAGTMVVTFLNSFLWFFGLHGTNVVSSVMTPLWYAARDANLLVYQADPIALRPYIVTNDFSNMIIFLGGTGLTLPLAFEMIFMCKSDRVRTIGKGGLIPGIFNVNEPIIFGLPLVMNPVMVIPFILVPMVCTAVAFFSMAWGLVPLPTGVAVPWTMPFFFGGWLMCNDIRGGILQLVILVIAAVIYYPFIKTLDKQYIKEEKAKQEMLEDTKEGS